MLQALLKDLTKEETDFIKLVSSSWNVDKKPFNFQKENTNMTEIEHLSPFIDDLEQSSTHWTIIPTQAIVDLLIALSYIDDLTCCSECGAQLTKLDEGYGTPHSACLDCLNF
jgi:hypothetical protein